jgi:DNA polymerase V
MHRKVRNTFSIFIPESQDGKGKANIFANAIKHDFKSKNPTTRWSDVIKLK